MALDRVRELKAGKLRWTGAVPMKLRKRADFPGRKDAR